MAFHKCLQRRMQPLLMHRRRQLTIHFVRCCTTTTITTAIAIVVVVIVVDVSVIVAGVWFDGI